MKVLLTILVALVGATWAWDVFNTAYPSTVHSLWILRQNTLYLTGFTSIGLMSLAMFLATRPMWLESPFGGMDRIYRSHKWAGILAVVFAAMHWLIELSGDILKSTIGREGRVPKEEFSGLLEVLRHLAKDMGEWAIYAVLLMLLVSLWKRFPYHTWRVIHRAMPIIYLVLAFHAAFLAPVAYWVQPAGALLALFLIAGIYGAIRSLSASIGRSNLSAGKIVGIDTSSPGITTVRCEMLNGWPGHKAGQFAFVTFSDKEGAHPFTIANADHGDRIITFHIKALGDYTASIAKGLQVGQTMRVNGPYGRFELERCDPKAKQIWVAGGIGITPFIAWLETLKANPTTLNVELHYCIRNQDTDVFVPRLVALCADIPAVRLHIHSARRGAALKAKSLSDTKNAEIWFCGPSGFADALRNGLRDIGRYPRFHQEAFEMR